MPRSPHRRLLICPAVTMWLVSIQASGAWIKPLDSGDPVPDVDKSDPDRSCWLATAANMLAGAGYGVGVTAQERADVIYDQLVDQYGSGL